MVVNGQSLLMAAPIKNMLKTKIKENGVSHGLAEAGYDIRIKQEITFFPKYGYGQVRAVIDDVITYTEFNGNFVLASTIDEFDMPFNLMGIVHDKSTWARRGLSVFNTVIESGWKGFLTLELVHHGRETLVIPAGTGIAQVIFHKLAERANYGEGKYQNQADKPVAAILE